MKVMICGRDCHKDDANCNGYCTGKVKSPPEATQAQKHAWAKLTAETKLREAQVSAYDYFCTCKEHGEAEAAYARFKILRDLS